MLELDGLFDLKDGGMSVRAMLVPTMKNTLFCGPTSMRETVDEKLESFRRISWLYLTDVGGACSLQGSPAKVAQKCSGSKNSALGEPFYKEMNMYRFALFRMPIPESAFQVALLFG